MPRQTLTPALRPDVFLSDQFPPGLVSALQAHWQPLAATIAGWSVQAAHPLLIGLSGAQGSGKSTLAALLVQLLARRHGLRTVAVSLDDFYLTRIERQQLAATIHPLLATRGPPGTHDLLLMQDTLAALQQPGQAVAIPRFHKPIDDRAPESDWPRLPTPVDVIIFEGWCLGARPQAGVELTPPLNALEAEDDPNCVWREYVNNQLASSYARLWASFDKFLLLQAPSWSSICRWRAEAERLLPGGPAMTAPELACFMQHYERTARSLLAAPPQADMVWRLDENRRVAGRT